MNNNILKERYQHRYDNCYFKGKRDNEEIILMLRRHWLIIAYKLGILIFLLTIFLILNYLNLLNLGTAPFFVNLELVLLFDSFALMFFWLVLFVVWIDYYFDVWIVTDQRIISIEQFGLFRREISELEHSKIQDVTTEIHGVIPTLLKFGYVYIQTAGEKSRFTFKQIGNPVKVKNMIMKLQKYSLIQKKKEEGQILRGKA